MATETQESLAKELRAALRIAPGDGGDVAMIEALTNQHPADIAEAMAELDDREALAVFNWLDNERAAGVLEELDPDTQRYLMENAPRGRMTDLLVRLPMDDRADVISEATPEQAAIILDDLERQAPEDAAEARELLGYQENTAGRLMTDNFIRVAPSMTVEEAFAAVRHADPDVETLTELYVVDNFDISAPLTRPQQGERLLGVLPLRLLVRASPTQQISEIMIAEPLTVSVDTDQEEVARIFAKYSFLALPVLDRRGELAGIITMDDILHVVVEEQTEDVLALGAVSASEQPYLASSVISTVRQRFGWLLMLFVAATASEFVMRHFQWQIGKLAALTVFIPLLIGTGGNAGAQTVTTITRALALNEVRFSDIMRVLWREMRTGLILGLMLALIGFGRALWGGSHVDLALTVSLSMIVIVVWAVTVGSVLPITFKRLGFDPAVMSAPFITTLVDATGLFLYFTIAYWLIRDLH